MTHLQRCFVLACCSLVVLQAHAQTRPRTTTSKRELAFGAMLGPIMTVTASEGLFNYTNYTPPGLGVRWGINGGVRVRYNGSDARNPGFGLIGEARYTSMWHSDNGKDPRFTYNARYSMITVSGGVEQAIGSGRTRPFIGLTIDVNAIAPGSLTTTLFDGTTYHSSTTDLTGTVWQLRFGVTPRIGVRAQLAKRMMLETIIAYQVVNLVNRADYAPKNALIDQYGKEALLSHAWMNLGLSWLLKN
jgi:hypothetical protein